MEALFMMLRPETVRLLHRMSTTGAIILLLSDPKPLQSRKAGHQSGLSQDVMTAAFRQGA